MDEDFNFDAGNFLHLTVEPLDKNHIIKQKFESSPNLYKVEHKITNEIRVVKEIKKTLFNKE